VIVFIYMKENQEVSIKCKLTHINEEARVGVCVRCGTVKLNSGGFKKGLQFWRCSQKNTETDVEMKPFVRRQMRSQEGKPVHSLTDINDEARTGTCSICGPVEVLRGPVVNGKRYYHCRTSKGERVRPLYVHKHRLSEINLDNLTATCQTCGPTTLKKGGIRDGIQTWQCQNIYPQRKEGGKILALRQHTLSDINTETLKGICKKCGEVDLVSRGMIEGKPQWRCWNANKHNSLMANFGISFDEYSQMLKDQDGECACCHRSQTETMKVDHDHLTGEVRGLLCQPCNFGLGHFKDSITRLDQAKQYLIDTLTKDDPDNYNPQAVPIRKDKMTTLFCAPIQDRPKNITESLTESLTEVSTEALLPNS
jgi:hypothetical protein